jgi:hypothetical protein
MQSVCNLGPEKITFARFALDWLTEGKDRLKAKQP